MQVEVRLPSGRAGAIAQLAEVADRHADAVKDVRAVEPPFVPPARDDRRQLGLNGQDAPVFVLAALAPQPKGDAGWPQTWLPAGAGAPLTKAA